MENKYESQAEAERRVSFYTNEEVKRYLKKNGIPKTKRAMKALVEVLYPNADNQTVESIGHVHFVAYPQQINIRDKTNERLIISLEK